MAVTVLALVTGTVKVWPEISRLFLPALDVTGFAPADDAMSLSVTVMNRGREPSRPHWSLELKIDQPGVIEFGPLLPRSPDKVIAAGGSTDLPFDIAHISPEFDVDDAREWERHKMRKIIMTGTVFDSNGVEHHITPREKPIGALQPLLIKLVPRVERED